MSLSSGVMPDPFEVAELHPALKKSNADHEQYSNFRPISNLPLVSKVIEKAIADQSIQHVQKHDLHEAFLQSAYKTCRSTETALIRVQNDLYAIDNRNSVKLLLLDLSAAFDTVKHSTMLTRLSTNFGVKGNALAWFRSYFTSRKQYICVESSKSSL